MRIAVVIGPGSQVGNVAAACAGWPADVDVEIIPILATAGGGAVVDALAGAAHAADGIVLDAGALSGSSSLDAVIAAVPVPVQRAFPGRGEHSLRWAIRALYENTRAEFETLRYGRAPDQVGDLRLPPGDDIHPVVALIHGGFWREPWHRDLMAPLANDLVRRGYATWNVEYRRVGESGGGWPVTAEDVADAVDALTVIADDHPVDAGQVVLVGHSAGGHLALVTAARERALVRPSLVVALAAVSDLVDGARRGLGDGAVAELMGGGPDDLPERYAEASPIARLPLPSPVLLVHGEADDRVPVAQSEAFWQAAHRAGGRVDAETLAKVDHFAVIDPRSDAWQLTAEHITERVPPA